MISDAAFFRVVLFLIIFFCSSTLFGQKLTDDEYTAYAKRSFTQLKDLLSMPNDAHFPDDIEVNVKWCETEFEKRGFELQRLETETVPLLLAEKRTIAKGAKTVLIYLQVDGQPVDPRHWLQDDPYAVVLKERTEDKGWVPIPWDKLEGELDLDWRMFARSTSDSKGAVNMFLTANDIMLEKGEIANFNMKVIMDFEEEIGSPRLPSTVVTYKDALEADMLIIFDGPMHISNQPTLTYGARGITSITLKVFGPNFPQHSGHYGNWVPNPAVHLSRLIASMKADNGKVTIPGFYDGIELSEEVKNTLAQIPDNEPRMNYSLGIAQPQGLAPTYQESLQYPSLNVRGFASGWVGEERRTIVPATAIAEIDIRLVMESDPDRLIGLVRDHITSEGYHLIEGTPTKEERVKYPKICSFRASTSYLAFRTAYDSDVGVWLDNALTKAFGKAPLKLRTTGGSIPISPFVTELGVPAVIVPTVQRDNNQHSPNENLRVGNYIDGIKTIHSILTEPLK
ncbi:MAG: M20/M25/M40 family metallo-hydrolase [Bacteroidota bacterium]